MQWDYSGLITGEDPVILPYSFDSQLLIVQATASNQRSTWYRSGYLQTLVDIDSQTFRGTSYKIGFDRQVVEIPYRNYSLQFQPVRWANDLTIDIKQLSSAEAINIMGINFAPNVPETLGAEAITTVAASITSVTLDPANPLRREGFVVNRSNRNLWVAFSATAPTAAAPSNLVTPGSNIDIPDNYTGVITGIWSGPTPTLNCEVHQFSAV